MDFITDITHWHWFIAAVILGIFELLVPGIVFIWMGLAAAFVGLIVLMMPDLAWEVQVIAFTLLSIITVICARILIAKRNKQSDHPMLNEKSAQYVGNIYQLISDSQNKRGKIKIGDTLWDVELSTDASHNSEIRITEAKGVLLKADVI
jgi:inner membrane protein